MFSSDSNRVDKLHKLVCSVGIKPTKDERTAADPQQRILLHINSLEEP
jgi:hypothetical protein